MILIRWGSAKALNSRAVASACSSDRLGAPSGAQHAAGATVSLGERVVMVIAAPPGRPRRWSWPAPALCERGSGCHRRHRSARRIGPGQGRRVEIVKTLWATPVLRALVGRVDDGRLRRRPAPEEWAIIEVVGQMADTED